MDSCTASTPYALIYLCDFYAQNGDLGQFQNDDVDMDSSVNLDDYPDSFASNSSCPPPSISMSTGVTSDCSWPSEAHRSFDEQISGMLVNPEPLATWQDPAGMQTRMSGPEKNYIYPQLLSLNPTSSDTWHASGNRYRKDSGHFARDDTVVQKTNEHTLRSPFQVLPEQHTTNDCNNVFNDLQATTPSIEQDVSWLVNWANRYPNTYPKMEKLKSLEYLSGMLEANIVAWLREHFDNQTNSKVDLMVTDTDQPPRSQRAPRYRPKCLKSRRRFRHVPETPKTMKTFECTRQCGESFKKKGDWKRHELYNIEEWRCHICNFAPSRKDKLPKHLQECHDYYGPSKKSHCRQLLHASARPCGFCGMRFRDWSTWLNHVAAHFEGHIPGGPWTMTRWRKDIAQDLCWGENNDDDDDDDDDQDNHDNNEDEGGHDSSDNRAKRADDQSTKGKGPSSGSGARGSSRVSRSPKSQSTGNHNSKSNAAGIEILVTEMSTSLSPTGGDEQRNPKLIQRGGEHGFGEIEFSKEMASLKKSQDLVLGGSPNPVSNATQTAHMGGKPSLKLSASNVGLDQRLGSTPQIKEDFVGREAELAQLHEWLAPRRNVVALCGLGGMGKTQLSMQFVRKFGDIYSAVFWFNAKDDTTPKTGMAGLGMEITEGGTGRSVNDPHDDHSGGHRKVLLSEGAVFHVPSSPPTENEVALSIHHLPHLSPTCSLPWVETSISEKEDVTTNLSVDFDEAFTDARGTQLNGHRWGFVDTVAIGRSEAPVHNPSARKNYYTTHSVPSPSMAQRWQQTDQMRHLRQYYLDKDDDSPTSSRRSPEMETSGPADFSEASPHRAVLAVEKRRGHNDKLHAFTSYYHTPHHEQALGRGLNPSNPKRDYIRDAVRATSAVPVFFQKPDVSGTVYMDGGLKANNPSRWAWDEAWRKDQERYWQRANGANSGSDAIAPDSLEGNCPIGVFVSVGTAFRAPQSAFHRGDPLRSIRALLRRAHSERKELNPHYKEGNDVVPFFTNGRVFPTLLRETAGENKSTQKPNSRRSDMRHQIRGQSVWDIYHCIRRMAVVRESRAYMWCIPIITYNYNCSNKGVLGPGISDQGIQAHGRVYPTERAFSATAQQKIGPRPWQPVDGIQRTAEVAGQRDSCFPHYCDKRHCVPHSQSMDNTRCDCHRKRFQDGVDWELSHQTLKWAMKRAVLNHIVCQPFIVTHAGHEGRAQSVKTYVLFAQHDYGAARASLNAPVGTEFRKCHRSLLLSHTGHHTYKTFGTASFGSSGFANVQRLPDGKVSSDVCHDTTACSLQTACASAGRGDVHAANSDGEARRKGTLNAIYATHGNHGKRTSRLEEYGNDESRCGEDALLVCDGGGGTVDVISYTTSCRGSHEGKSSFPDIEARESASKKRFAALPPRAANFDTIRKLYGVKDRARLARFKMERFLNEPDDDCCWEGSMVSDSLQDRPWVYGDLNMEVSAPDNRLPSDEDSYRAAGVASSLIPGASRRGRKKIDVRDARRIPHSSRSPERPNDWPI